MNTYYTIYPQTAHSSASNKGGCRGHRTFCHKNHFCWLHENIDPTRSFCSFSKTKQVYKQRFSYSKIYIIVPNLLHVASIYTINIIFSYTCYMHLISALRACNVTTKLKFILWLLTSTKFCTQLYPDLHYVHMDLNEIFATVPRWNLNCSEALKLSRLKREVYWFLLYVTVALPAVCRKWPWLGASGCTTQHDKGAGHCGSITGLLIG